MVSEARSWFQKRRMSEVAKLATMIELIAVKQPGRGSGRGNQQDRYNREKGGQANRKSGKPLAHERSWGLRPHRKAAEEPLSW